MIAVTKKDLTSIMQLSTILKKYVEKIFDVQLTDNINLWNMNFRLVALCL